MTEEKKETQAQPTQQPEQEKKKEAKREPEKLLLDYAKAAADIGRKNFRFKAALGGRSGTGKTTSAVKTLPGKKLLLDYDQRAESVAGDPDTKIITIREPDPTSPKAWKVAERLCDELWMKARMGTLEYDAVIEDGLTSMNRIAMNWALLLDQKRGLGGSPAKQHYGPQMHNLANHILKMKALPVHYILTMHLELHQEGESGVMILFPKIYGKTRDEVGGWFNECYFCRHLTDEEEKIERYYWYTAGYGKYDFFKSALNNPVGKYWKDPLEIDLTKEITGFRKILDLRFGSEQRSGDNSPDNSVAGQGEAKKE